MALAGLAWSVFAPAIEELPRIRWSDEIRPFHLERLIQLDLHRPEGEIAGVFGELQQRYPDVPMGSYPFYRDGQPGTQLVLRSTDPARLAEAEAELKALLTARGWL